MPNDDNKIILEFPATNVEIELGETITFDNISGFLDSERVTYNGDSLTEIITHLEDDKADTTYVDTELAKKADKTDTYTKTQVDNALNNKMNKANPTGTGSIAVGSNMLNIGSNSQTFGSNTKALGNNAFATGENTQASVANQFVFGKYNQYSFGNLVEIVGNGTSESNRSNARTLDWQGNETLAGNLTFNGNKSLTSEISRLDGRIDTKANASDVYTKSQTDNLLNGKANASDVYTKQTTDALLNDKADVSDLPDMSQYYDKSEVDYLLDDKANSDDVYGKAYIDTALSGKANVGTSYTKSEEDALLDDKADKSDTYTKEQVDDIVYDILPDDTASGSIANFETDLALPLKSARFDVNASGGGGTPTTPIPIVGVSSVSVTRCGANLCNQAEIVSAYPSKYTVDADGSIKTVGNLSVADVLWTNKSKVSGVLNVIFVSKYQNTGSVGIRPKIIYTDGTNSVIYPTNTQDYSTKTLLTTLGKTVEKIVVDYGTNNPTNFFLDVTLDTGATTYEAYNGTDVIIALGGTYYGGYVTQDKAGHRQLVVTHTKRTLTGAQGEVWEYYSVAQGNLFRFYAPISEKNIAVTSSNTICNAYRATTSAQRANGTVSGLAQYVDFINDNFTDLATFKASLTNNPIEVAYPIVTPIIIDLPDGTPLSALVGINNLFADSGDMECSYKESVELYVNKRIAEVQALILG